jgi:hypothetical protein
MSLRGSGLCTHKKILFCEKCENQKFSFQPWSWGKWNAEEYYFPTFVNNMFSLLFDIDGVV